MAVLAPAPTRSSLNTYTPLAQFPIDPRATELVGEDFARAHRLAPLRVDQETLLVAVANPDDTPSVDELRRRSGRPCKVLVSTWMEIELALCAAFRPDNFRATLSRGFARFLLDIGLINREQHTEITGPQAENGQPVDQLLVQKSILDEQSILEIKSMLFCLGWVKLESQRINTSLAPVIPVGMVERMEVLPLFLDSGSLVVAGPDLLRWDQIEELGKVASFPVRQVLCARSSFARALQRAYGSGSRHTEEAKKSFDEALLEGSFVSSQELRQAESIRQATGENLEAILSRLGFLDNDKAFSARAFQIGVEAVSLRDKNLHGNLAMILPEAFSRRYGCLPFARNRNYVSLAMADPADTEAIRVISELTGATIKPFLCMEEDLDTAQELVYRHLGADQHNQRSGSLDANAGQGYAPLYPPGGYGPTERSLQEERTGGPGTRLVVAQVQLERFKLQTDTVLLIPEETAREHCLVAVCKQDNVLTVAMTDPSDHRGIATIQKSTGLTVKIVLSHRQAIEGAVEEQYAAAAIDVEHGVRDFTNYLVSQGVLRQEQLRDIWSKTARGFPVDLAVLETGAMSEEEVALALAEHQHLEYLDISPFIQADRVLDAVGQPAENRRQIDPVDPVIARLMSAETATSIAAVPIGMSSKPSDSIIVAFANPLDKAAFEAVQRLSRPFQPVVSTREKVLDAIRRALGRISIGDYLVKGGVITPKQQNEALQLHRKTGVRMGKALLSLGFITDEQLVTLLAEQQDIAFYDLSAMAIDHRVVRTLPEDFERERRVIPIEKDHESLTLAMVDSLDKVALKEAARLTGLSVHPVLTTEDSFNRVMEEVYRKDYLQRSSTELVFRYPDESAYQVLSPAQKAVALAFLAVSAVLVAWNHITYFLILNSLATMFYVSSSMYKLYLIYRSLTHTLEVPISDEEVALLNERDLPVYSILIPLYRESRVVPRLITAIDALDYPKTKLDVKLLLEEDDTETIAAIQRYSLPPHFKIVVVPDATPKGKPKACNYGLIHADGQYVVIFDAEDIPEPDQLKKAIVAFRKADESVVCIQAKLNYYNRDQNLLTRWFTAEYSMWFDLLLPGLDADDVPIPLGGTSNHFPTAILQELGAWDPHNVTEDADLGMRLYKSGWKTAVIDSTTYEEANSQVYNWIRQRSRWVKGYIQTYLVHMRHPLRLWRSVGTKAFLSFNMVIGGTFLSFLLNPLYWGLTALWFLTQWSFIRDLYPSFIFYIGCFGLYIGNFVFTYINVAGCLKRGYYDMVKYALLTPIYWALMSVAAWKGFLQLFYKPSYWEKTVHGLYKGEAATSQATGWRDLFFRRKSG